MCLDKDNTITTLNSAFKHFGVLKQCQKKKTPLWLTATITLKLVNGAWDGVSCIGSGLQQQPQVFCRGHPFKVARMQKNLHRYQITLARSQE